LDFYVLNCNKNPNNSTFAELIRATETSQETRGVTSARGMCDRVAHVSAEGADAHARDEQCPPFRAEVIKLKPDTYDGSVSLNEFLILVSIDCSSEPLDRGSENHDFNIMFKRENAGSFGKRVGFRKFEL